MARRAYNGGAVPTTVTAQVNPTDISISIAAATNWPAGGASGEFVCTLNPGLPNEERILVQSRTGTTLTLASTAKRGVDGTSAGTHVVNSVIIHSDAAFEADEANRHINDAAQAVTEHSSLLDATRHAAITHTAAMLGTDSVGTDEIAANAVTSSELADNAVDTNAIQALAVTAAKIANDTITATQIAADAVGTSEIAALAVTDAELAAAAVIAGKIAAGGVSATGQIADGIISLAKFLSEASTSYTPATFCSGGTFSLGTGGTKYGHYFKLGRIVVGWAGFAMAADGNLVGTLDIPLPVAMRTTSDGQRGFAAGRAQAGSQRWSGVGVIVSGGTIVPNLATAGASTEWDTTTPFNWGTGGVGQADLDAIFFYEAAS